MSRAVLVLANDEIRHKAARWAMKVPVGTRVEWKGPKRTLPQNDKFWALLTEVSEQVLWHGVKLSSEDWKLMFLDALHRELRIVPNLDGTGFVNLRQSSSDLSIAEMSDCIELIYAFGARHGVTFYEKDTAA